MSGFEWNFYKTTSYNFSHLYYPTGNLLCLHAHKEEDTRKYRSRATVGGGTPHTDNNFQDLGTIGRVFSKNPQAGNNHDCE